MRFFVSIFIIFFSAVSFAQHSLNGSVKNENGELLEFAVIYLEGTKLSTSTEKNGSFIIENIPAGNYILSCTFLGYHTQKKEVTINRNTIVDFVMTGNLFNLQEIEISSNRNKLTTFPSGTFLNKEELNKENLGQDIPALLQWQPSVTTTSDAGNNIGYTGIRIRGVDPSRINVTINDIPLNDAESQGVFWVDLPDFASSTQNLKIQRSVGPSTNGAGAYGGTIGLNSFGLTINPTAEIKASYGSFNTSKISVGLNSGLMNNQYNVEARYSSIKSDGYIDRAASDLSSWYISAAKVNSKSSLRFIAFSGKERTYQSWNGAPEALVIGDKTALQNHYNNNIGTLYKSKKDSINLFSSDRRYNAYLYKDQVDQYAQTHTQLHWANNLNKKLTAKLSLHYTKGNGYYEQYRFNDNLIDYNLSPIIVNNDTFNRSNLVRRRWLDNDFYGSVGKIEYNINSKSLLSIGGAYNIYDGNHFGNVISIEIDSLYFPKNNYYRSKSKKKDDNIYLRYEAAITSKINLSGDFQYRNVSYTASGIDNNLKSIDINKKYNFFNPKFAINYKLNADQTLIASYAVANREPDRSDFIDNPKNKTPLHESLYDTELSYAIKKAKKMFEASVYYMNYKNQLVITGELNDVGNNFRINTPSSYRLGLELTFNTALSDKINWQINTTISKNKIKNFTEIIYDYTNGFEVQENKYINTDISFSPSVIASNVLNFKASPLINFALSTKYIGKQFLDNTMNEKRTIPPYTFTNLRVEATPKISFTKSMSINLQLNNLFNTLYSSNGYSYSYKYGNLITENFLYPQAGINFMIGVNAKF